MDYDYEADVSPMEDPIFGMGASQTARLEAERKAEVFSQRSQARELFLAASLARLEASEENRQNA